MQTIRPETTADLFFDINWSSPGVHHTDAFTARPGNDAYYGQLPYSDPVDVVWGKAQMMRAE